MTNARVCSHIVRVCRRQLGNGRVTRLHLCHAEEECEHTSCRTRDTDEVRLLGHERDGIFENACSLCVRQTSFMEEVVLKQLEIWFPSTRRRVEEVEFRVVRMIGVRRRNLVAYRVASACVLVADICPVNPARVELGVLVNNANVRF